MGVRAGAGRAILNLTGGTLAPRVISQDSSGARVALVATTALLLGGDTVRLDLEVGPGAWLEIVETAGMVAFDAGGQESSWQLRASIGDGGLLLWNGQPFVVADGANVLRCNDLELGHQSMVCIRETIVLGRTAAPGGAARIRNRVVQRDSPLLIEELDLTDRRTRELPGILGAARVIDTVMLLGASIPDFPAAGPGRMFRLHNGIEDDSDDGSGERRDVGTIARELLGELAGSPMDRLFPAWSQSARLRYRSRSGPERVLRGATAR